MDTITIKTKILEKGETCDHCLGRQVTHRYKGIKNEHIGAAIRHSNTEKEIKEKIEQEKPQIKLTKNCFLCKGLFTETDKMYSKLLEEVNQWEFQNFLVGSKIPNEVVEQQEKLWTEIPPEDAEPVRREINRELGKKLSQHLKMEPEFEEPEIVFILNFEQKKVETQVRSLYIYGKYRKLKRGIPQTKWPCTHCKGEGCEECEQTGKQYKHTVEDLVAENLMEATQTKEHKFHGAGREDKDALMLGEGRPFVVEMVTPKRRNPDLEEVQEKINKQSKGMIEVQNLRESNSEEVVKLKSEKRDKTYEVWAETRDKVTEKDLKKVEKQLEEQEVEQRTPTRVSHRRADRVRKRKVHTIKLQKENENQFKAKIRAESGTYIKELISGDYGRTRPSVAEILKTQVTPKKLNVLKIHEPNND